MLTDSRSFMSTIDDDYAQDRISFKKIGQSMETLRQLILAEIHLTFKHFLQYNCMNNFMQIQKKRNFEYCSLTF